MSVFNPCWYRPLIIIRPAVRGFKAVVQICFLAWAQPHSAGRPFIHVRVHCFR